MKEVSSTGGCYGDWDILFLIYVSFANIIWIRYKTWGIRWTWHTSVFNISGLWDSWVYFHLLVRKLPAVHGGREETEETEERQAAPDWQVAELRSKGTYLQGFVLGGHKTRRFLHSPTSLRNLYRSLNWVQSHTIQIVSATPYSLSAESLKMVSPVGTVGRAWIPRTREGVRGLLLPSPVWGSTDLSVTSCNNTCLSVTLRYMKKSHEGRHSGLGTRNHPERLAGNERNGSDSPWSVLSYSVLCE